MLISTDLFLLYDSFSKVEGSFAKRVEASFKKGKTEWLRRFTVSYVCIDRIHVKAYIVDVILIGSKLNT